MFDCIMLSSTMDVKINLVVLRTYYVSASSICYGIVIFSRALQFEIAITCGVIAVHNTIYIHDNCMLYTRVEIGSGHPGQLGHILSGSSGSDPLYKISGSEPDSTLYHVH